MTYSSTAGSLGGQVLQLGFQLGNFANLKTKAFIVNLIKSKIQNLNRNLIQSLKVKMILKNLRGGPKKIPHLAL